MIKKMDHNAYQRKVKFMDAEQLRFIIQDCKEVIRVMPDNPNVSYYLDEICYCDAELARRKRRNDRGYY